MLEAIVVLVGFLIGAGTANWWAVGLAVPLGVLIGTVIHVEASSVGIGFGAMVLSAVAIALGVYAGRARVR